MPGWRRGSLNSDPSVPERGERTEVVARMRGCEVEHILSGELDGPVDYLQEHDEWVLVLRGAGTVRIDGETIHLGPGDWVMIPAGTAHRLVETRPGTTWLAVHAGRG